MLFSYLKTIQIILMTLLAGSQVNERCPLGYLFHCHMKQNKNRVIVLVVVYLYNFSKYAEMHSLQTRIYVQYKENMHTRFHLIKL